MAATARKKASSSPHAAAGAAVAEIDDILGEIDPPAKTVADDGLDDVPGPAADAGFNLEDFLGEIDAPTPANTDDDLDDILDEVAASAPVLAEPAESPDAPEPPSIPAAIADLDEVPANPPLPTETDASSKGDEMEGDSTVEELDATPTKKRRARPKLGLPSLSGQRQISRKAHLGLIGLITLFGLTTAAETAFIAMHGFNHGEAKPKAMVVTMAPVDYAKVDLARYAGKRRTLREGGRDVLRNGAVKAAILDLDNGEDLYRDIRDIAQHSAAADHMTIADNHIMVTSCDNVTCGDKRFRVVYDLVGKRASVCMTEKYLNNSTLSYSYSEEGYSEVAGCH